ncbi:MAG: hypothetical protein Q4C25_04330 [Bacillota bacterium]|nr:hypothetical protein [Bacillota bacterium]
MSISLIDYIFERSGLSFVSDMKFHRDENLLRLIEGIAVDDFPEEEWKDLHEYLFGRRIKSDDPVYIREYIIKHIEKPL